MDRIIKHLEKTYDTIANTPFKTKKEETEAGLTLDGLEMAMNIVENYLSNNDVYYLVTKDIEQIQDIPTVQKKLGRIIGDQIIDSMILAKENGIDFNDEVEKAYERWRDGERY